MQNKWYLLISTSLFIVACGVSHEDYSKVVESNKLLQQECESLKEIVLTKENEIRNLKDSLVIYSYPADQRLFKIKELVTSDELEKAEVEISNLKLYFPNSKEAKQSNELVVKISKRKAEIEAEKERIKAMGFKLLKDNMVIKNDDGTARFSGFSFGNTFVFDEVLDVDEYHYRTADKDNVYILVSMSFSSNKKYVSTPSLAAYLIKDGKLERLRYFVQEYATYRTYGAYIGNYSEDSHDFSKVSTVRYKLAAEISKEDSKKPIIVMVQESKNDEMELTPEYVMENCKVIKVLNRNKL